MKIKRVFAMIICLAMLLTSYLPYIQGLDLGTKAEAADLVVGTFNINTNNIYIGQYFTIYTDVSCYYRVYRADSVPTSTTKYYFSGVTNAGSNTNFKWQDVPTGVSLCVSLFASSSSYTVLKLNGTGAALTKTITSCSSSSFRYCIDGVNRTEVYSSTSTGNASNLFGVTNFSAYCKDDSIYYDEDGHLGTTGTTLNATGTLELDGWLLTEKGVQGFYYSVDNQETWTEITTYDIASAASGSTDTLDVIERPGDNSGVREQADLYFSNDTAKATALSTAMFYLVTPALTDLVSSTGYVYIAAKTGVNYAADHATDYAVFYAVKVTKTDTSGEINLVSPANGASVTNANTTVQNFSDTFEAGTYDADSTDDLGQSSGAVYNILHNVNANNNGGTDYFRNSPDFKYCIDAVNRTSVYVNATTPNNNCSDVIGNNIAGVTEMYLDLDSTDLNTTGKLNAAGTLELDGWFLTTEEVTGYYYSTDDMETWTLCPTSQVKSSTNNDDTFSEITKPAYNTGVNGLITGSYTNTDSSMFYLVTGDISNVSNNTGYVFIAAKTESNYYIPFFGLCIKSTSTKNEAIKVSSQEEIETDYSEYYDQDAIKLQWNYDGTEDYYIVTIAADSSFTNAKYYKTTNNYLNIKNLYSDSTYYWKVKAVDADNSSAEKESATYCFNTADYFRTVTIDGVKNTRDFGGKDTIYGVKTKQGIVYRGGRLTSIKVSGQDTLFNTLGIKTELAVDNSKTSALSSKFTNQYEYVGSVYEFAGTSTLDSTVQVQTSLKNQLLVFADSSNYPIYCHCTIGRDRTGTLALLLNGLLGVSQKDAIEDYMFSLLSDVGNNENSSNDMTSTGGYYYKFLYGNTGHFIRNLRRGSSSWNGGTSDSPDVSFNVGCYNYCKNALGLTDAQITAIRENMLEDSVSVNRDNILSDNDVIESDGETIESNVVVYPTAEPTAAPTATPTPGSTEGPKSGTAYDIAVSITNAESVSDGVYTVTYDGAASHELKVNFIVSDWVTADIPTEIYCTFYKFDKSSSSSVGDLLDNFTFSKTGDGNANLFVYQFTQTVTKTFSKAWDYGSYVMYYYVKGEDSNNKYSSYILFDLVEESDSLTTPVPTFQSNVNLAEYDTKDDSDYGIKYIYGESNIDVVVDVDFDATISGTTNTLSIYKNTGTVSEPAYDSASPIATLSLDKAVLDANTGVYNLTHRYTFPSVLSYSTTENNEYIVVFTATKGDDTWTDGDLQFKVCATETWMSGYNDGKRNDDGSLCNISEDTDHWSGSGFYFDQGLTNGYQGANPVTGGADSTANLLVVNETGLGFGFIIGSRTKSTYGDTETAPVTYYAYDDTRTNQFIAQKANYCDPVSAVKLRSIVYYKNCNGQSTADADDWYGIVDTEQNIINNWSSGYDTEFTLSFKSNVPSQYKYAIIAVNANIMNFTGKSASASDSCTASEIATRPTDYDNLYKGTVPFAVYTYNNSNSAKRYNVSGNITLLDTSGTGSEYGSLQYIKIDLTKDTSWDRSGFKFVIIHDADNYCYVRDLYIRYITFYTDEMSCDADASVFQSSTEVNDEKTMYSYFTNEASHETGLTEAAADDKAESDSAGKNSNDVKDDGSSIVIQKGTEDATITVRGFISSDAQNAEDNDVNRLISDVEEFREAVAVYNSDGSFNRILKIDYSSIRWLDYNQNATVFYKVYHATYGYGYTTDSSDPNGNEGTSNTSKVYINDDSSTDNNDTNTWKKCEDSSGTAVTTGWSYVLDSDGNKVTTTKIGFAAEHAQLHSEADITINTSTMATGIYKLRLVKIKADSYSNDTLVETDIVQAGYSTYNNDTDEYTDTVYDYRWSGEANNKVSYDYSSSKWFNIVQDYTGSRTDCQNGIFGYDVNYLSVDGVGTSATGSTRTFGITYSTSEFNSDTATNYTDSDKTSTKHGVLLCRTSGSLAWIHLNFNSNFKLGTSTKYGNSYYGVLIAKAYADSAIAIYGSNSTNMSGDVVLPAGKITAVPFDTSECVGCNNISIAFMTQNVNTRLYDLIFFDSLEAREQYLNQYEIAGSNYRATSGSSVISDEIAALSADNNHESDYTSQCTLYIMPRNSVTYVNSGNTHYNFTKNHISYTFDTCEDLADITETNLITSVTEESINLKAYGDEKLSSSATFEAKSKTNTDGNYNGVIATTHQLKTVFDPGQFELNITDPVTYATAREYVKNFIDGTADGSTSIDGNARFYNRSDVNFAFVIDEVTYKDPSSNTYVVTLDEVNHTVVKTKYNSSGELVSTDNDFGSYYNTSIELDKLDIDECWDVVISVHFATSDIGLKLLTFESTDFGGAIAVGNDTRTLQTTGASITYTNGTVTQKYDNFANDIIIKHDVEKDFGITCDIDDGNGKFICWAVYLGDDDDVVAGTDVQTQWRIVSEEYQLNLKGSVASQYFGKTFYAIYSEDYTTSEGTGDDITYTAEEAVDQPYKFVFRDVTYSTIAVLSDNAYANINDNNNKQAVIVSDQFNLIKSSKVGYEFAGWNYGAVKYKKDSDSELTNLTTKYTTFYSTYDTTDSSKYSKVNVNYYFNNKTTDSSSAKCICYTYLQSGKTSVAAGNILLMFVVDIASGYLRCVYYAPRTVLNNYGTFYIDSLFKRVDANNGTDDEKKYMTATIVEYDSTGGKDTTNFGTGTDSNQTLIANTSNIYLSTPKSYVLDGKTYYFVGWVDLNNPATSEDLINQDDDYYLGTKATTGIYGNDKYYTYLSYDPDYKFKVTTNVSLYPHYAQAVAYGSLVPNVTINNYITTTVFTSGSNRAVKHQVTATLTLPTDSTNFEIFQFGFVRLAVSDATTIPTTVKTNPEDEDYGKTTEFLTTATPNAKLYTLENYYGCIDSGSDGNSTNKGGQYFLNINRLIGANLYTYVRAYVIYTNKNVNENEYLVAYSNCIKLDFTTATYSGATLGTTCNKVADTWWYNGSSNIS